MENENEKSTFCSPFRCEIQTLPMPDTIAT
jgi:hypothetical protein